MFTELDREEFEKERRSIFFGDVEYVHLGRKFGDFNPNHVGGIFRIINAATLLGLKSVALAMPSSTFSNQVLCLSQHAECFPWDSFSILYHRNKESDAILVERNVKIGLVIANADCHMGVFYHENSGKLALVHLGLRCLVPSDKKTNSIIDNIFAAMRESPSQIKVFVGGGIGCCCNGYVEGYEYLNYVKDLYPLAVVGKVEKGPREGQQAVEILTIIKQQLFSSQVKKENVFINYACSACNCEDGEQKYFSNVYDKEKAKERNLFLVKVN